MDDAHCGSHDLFENLEILRGYYKTKTLTNLSITMSKLNRLKYETYSKLEYLVNQKDAEAYFRVMSKFPNAVGYDKKSNGYLVINKNHSPSGLESEVGGCVVLKKLGYCVELLNESPSIVSLDVKVNDLIF